MGFIVAVLTIAVLTAYGWLLSWLWDNGFWFITASAFPLTMLVAYIFSSQSDRDEFKSSIARLFRR